jgi:dTMP kinase
MSMNKKTPLMVPCRGKFIVLEGGEGVGKSTQMQSIAHFLHTQSIPYILTREPGGTPLAEQLRTVIVGEEMDAIEEILLILAARRHHVRTVIEPALKAGLWVLCDRFSDSSLVYQGIVGGLDLALIQQWHAAVGCDLKPDQTFILQIDPEVALARREANHLISNRFDQKDIDFHNRIHQAYVEISKRDPKRYVCIPADGSLEKVTEIILKHIPTLISRDVRL